MLLRQRVLSGGRGCSFRLPSCLQAVLSNWKKEFEKWAPGVDVVVYDGSPDERRLLRTEHIDKGFFNAVVTHYDLIMRDRAVLRKVSPPLGSACSTVWLPCVRWLMHTNLLHFVATLNPGPAGCSPVFTK